MTIPDFELLLYDELDSTNEEAKRLLADGRITRPCLLRAESQTAGKGTHGRRWFSPPGAGLYCSVVHPFPGETLTGQAQGKIPLTPLFTLAAGVACAETIQELTGLGIQLKPINDLYVDGRKLGGILTESLISENHCRALITGIGINVFAHTAITDGCKLEDRGNLPASLQDCIPSHLFSQWHGDAIRQELALALARQVGRSYRMLIEHGGKVIVDQYAQYKTPEFDFPAEYQAILSR